MVLLLTSTALAGPLVDGDSAPAYRIAGGKGVATLLHNSSTGAADAALGLIALGPGAELGNHAHEGSVEMLYILEGTGRLTIAGQVFELGPADAVYIPANTTHSLLVTASIKAVQVFIGPGPEQEYIVGEKVTPLPR